MFPTNRIYLQEKAGKPGVFTYGPLPDVSDEQILVKAHAWALNPADGMVQDIALPFITYPVVMGEDVAGTVERVGASAAGKFQVGDRVLALAMGSALAQNEQSAFQQYVLHDHRLASHIPASMSFVDASVFPLCLATAAHGLFSAAYLGLSFPTLKSTTNVKTVLVWGGSSGVGANAIQLCKHAGYDVVTTCSPHNFELVKTLGAAKAFDHKSSTIVDELVAELSKYEVAGVLQAAGPSKPAIDVAAKLQGQKASVATTNLITGADNPHGVDAKWIYAEDGGNIYLETKDATFDGFFQEALVTGAYKVAPSPEVLPKKGLEGLQAGLDAIKKGVSAKKLVVTAE